MDSNVKARLICDLKALGVCEGDTVLMHSAYKPLGLERGGACDFFDAFFELLGENGTLVLPTLSYATVTRDNPVFDYYNTPSCVGYLSEYFRSEYQGTVRSMHPTHSCAAKGRLAKALTIDHELDLTPVGKNSPFTKLPQYNGKILMLGCNFGSITSMHGVEETAEPPYCIDRKNPIEYTLVKGDTVIKQNALRHNFNTEDGHVNQRYIRILDLLEEGTEYKIGQVLSANACLIRASALWEKGHKKLLEDPIYFVDYPSPKIK